VKLDHFLAFVDVLEVGLIWCPARNFEFSTVACAGGLDFGWL